MPLPYASRFCREFDAGGVGATGFSFRMSGLYPSYMHIKKAQKMGLISFIRTMCKTMKTQRTCICARVAAGADASRLWS